MLLMSTAILKIKAFFIYSSNIRTMGEAIKKMFSCSYIVWFLYSFLTDIKLIVVGSEGL